MVLDPMQQIASDVDETKARVIRVEERLGRFETTTNERLGRLETTGQETNERLGRFETTANERFLKLEVHASKAETDIAQIHEVLIGHDKRFDSLESRFDSLESRFDSLETNIATTFQAMNASMIAAVNLAFENFKRTSFEERLGRLEQAIFGNRT